MSLTESGNAQTEPIKAGRWPLKRDSRGQGCENVARGREAQDGGIRFNMCGWQMDLHALDRGRWTLSVLNFDFDDPSLKGKTQGRIGVF